MLWILELSTAFVVIENAHMAEWSKAVVLSFFLHRSIPKHHYRKMREFEPHCEQPFLTFKSPNAGVVNTVLLCCADVRGRDHGGYGDCCGYGCGYRG